jgi:hypothetical protein
MKSLIRPAVYQGVTYPDYEIDFYTSQVHSLRSGIVLKPYFSGTGYLEFNFQIEGAMKKARQHKILAETFYDLLSKSPLVSHYDLQIGKDRHELKTATGFRVICNMVCPDHIDGDITNNHYSNLMIVTQSENNIKRSPSNGKKYKSGSKDLRRDNSYRVQIRFPNVLDKNGKHFLKCKTFKTEEEAALAYNTMLEEALLTIFGPDLGPKMYDLAYKNVIKSPVQQKLTLS